MTSMYNNKYYCKMHVVGIHPIIYTRFLLLAARTPLSIIKGLCGQELVTDLALALLAINETV